MKSLKSLIGAAAVVATFGISNTAMTSTAEAAIITDAQTFELTNGANRPRGVTVFHEGERNNVNFETEGAEVFFTYDGESTARIHGTGYDEFLGEFVDINFVYSDIEQDPLLGLVSRGAGQGTIGDLYLGTDTPRRREFAFLANVDAYGALQLDGWLSDGGDFHAFGSRVPSSSGGGSVPAPGGLVLVLVGMAAIGRRFASKK